MYSFCKILTSFDKWNFNHRALVVEDDSVLVKCNSLLRSKGTSETIQTVHSQFIRVLENKTTLKSICEVYKTHSNPVFFVGQLHSFNYSAHLQNDVGFSQFIYK